jgi:hypothetical protein
MPNVLLLLSHNSGYGWRPRTPSKSRQRVCARPLRQGLAAILGYEWVAGIAQRMNVVKVYVADVRVEHEVKLVGFLRWLDRPPRSSRNVTRLHCSRASRAARNPAVANYLKFVIITASRMSVPRDKAR